MTTNDAGLDLGSAKVRWDTVRFESNRRAGRDHDPDRPEHAMVMPT